MVYTTSQSTMATISLPPISEIDPRSQHAAPFGRDRDERHHPAPHHPYPGSLQLPRPPFPPTSLHQHLGSDHHARPPWAAPYQSNPARVPLPVGADHSITSSRFGHKTKEVKRRTKTGCQTCRKRRIKCDESRPACRNCVKSKRECAGYDPVFQSHAGPSSIQLNPHSQPATTPAAVASAHLSPSLSVKTASSTTTESSYDHSDHTIRLEAIQRMEDHAHLDRIPAETSPYPISKAKKRTIDDLCTVDGNKRPNLPPLPSDPPNLDAIKRIYDTAFAPGLDKFLETTWFSTRAFQYLTTDRAFLAQILAYITLVHNVSLGQVGTAALASQEARITWALLGLCVRPNTPGSGWTKELQTLKGRLHAISILLTGEDIPPGAQIMHEDSQDESVIAPTSKLDSSLHRRSREFWQSVGRVISLSYNAYPDKDTAAIEDGLARCRATLDNLESRDIVYSIMTMRYLGGKWDTGDQDLARQDALQAQKQWNIARSFLVGAARGRSTNQVYATICGMALRAWD